MAVSLRTGKIYGATCLCPSVPADTSQRRTVGRGDLELAARPPAAISVCAQADGATEQLVED